MTVEVSKVFERSRGVLELETVSCVVEYGSHTELVETVSRLAPRRWIVRFTRDEGRTWQMLGGWAL